MLNQSKDGTPYWVSISITPVFDNDGTIKEYTSIKQNITDKKRTEKLSITDKLTQLYNRVKIEDIFSMEILKAQRYDTTFSIALIDVDYFKKINDTYGHNTGDMFLREFAQLLKKSARETDIIGRWGGEEFIMIIYECDLKCMLNIAEKIRQNIENFNFSVVGSKTASFGIAQYKVGDTQEMLLNRADEGLYQAKAQGRNKICYKTLQ